jgi:uncharacterized lipoprotein YmbA
MIPRRALLRGTAMLGALALAGCASANPNYYRLASIPGTALSGGPTQIEVRSVSIPGYLDRDGIVKGGGNYQLDIHDNDLWAEAFANMLQDSLVQDLSQRLPTATVTGTGGAISGAPDALVEVNLQRFDPNATGQMVLIAQLAIKAGGSHAVWSTRTLRYTAPAGGPKVANLVAVMSHLWAQLADDAATQLAQSRTHRPLPSSGD